jgi:hypothetical protein
MDSYARHALRCAELRRYGRVKLSVRIRGQRRGGRARLNAPDSKSDIGVSLSGVRIPPSPPATFRAMVLANFTRNSAHTSTVSHRILVSCSLF